MEILLSSINWGTFGIICGIVAGLAIIFAVLIVLVSKLCAVKTDEKVESVTSHLAGANCGGCGHTGCSDYAKALCEGKGTLNDCQVTDISEKEEIAKILNIPFEKGEKMVAVVRCGGGDNCKDKFSYVGNNECTAQVTFMGGKKMCNYGCLGGGSCKNVCVFNAMEVNNNLAKTDREFCKACGACAKKCPKGLIELIPARAKVYVACSSKCKGKDVITACTSGCIGCGLCAKNCEEGAITMIDNIPVIDYNKCTGCFTCLSKCPRKVIRKV